MKKSSFASRLLFFLSCCFLGEAVRAEEPAPLNNPLKFVRITRNEEGTPQSLDTAIMRYQPAAGGSDLIVDLIGAVHVGEQSYYEKLNLLFTEYDVVLYELVAPEGTRIPKGGRSEPSANPISMMQGMTKSMLGLASQLEHVDYTKENLVHADMSAADMKKAIESRGDNMLSFALSAMSDVVRQANKQAQQMDGNAEDSSEPDLISLVTDPQAGAKMKIMMAEQFDRMGGAEMMLGEKINETIVKDRNAAAMKVFQRQLTSGKKRVAIFYGAAHMPDFDRRLREDFGLKQVEKFWLAAWDLTKQPENQASPLNAFLRLLRE